ncbi:MAG: adenylate/guanylate cyclase domain-containing protein, partial [Bacteroidota bacterium]
KEIIESNKIYYFEKYSITPVFRASLHAGTLIQGLIGEVKSEIKYHGDTMNTCARILGNTTEEHDYLISEYLLKKVDLPAIYKSSDLGSFELKGKQKKVNLHSLSTAPVNHL